MRRGQRSAAELRRSEGADLSEQRSVGVHHSGVTLVTGVDGGVPIVADVNGDGIADAVVQSGNDLTMNLGEGSLMFAPSVTIGTGSAPGFALAVDAHGQGPLSGKPDLIVPDGSGVVNVYLNTTK